VDLEDLVDQEDHQLHQFLALQYGNSVEESTGEEQSAALEDHSALHRVNGILNVFQKDQLHSLLTLLNPLLHLHCQLHLDALLIGDNVED
jgi:hypothetical protein